MGILKKENEKSAKPKYNMWQCSAYMISLAWREKEKKILLLCLLQVFLAVMSNLVNLYVAPSVLSVVERGASITELLTMVLLFVILIMFCSAATSYVNSNTLYGRVTVRLALISAINKKACTTSYPNLFEKKFTKLSAKCQQATSNNQEATEAIWDTLTSLAQNCIGFVIYLFLLVSVDIWLMLVILLTSLPPFSAKIRSCSRYPSLIHFSKSQFSMSLSFFQSS